MRTAVSLLLLSLFFYPYLLPQTLQANLGTTVEIAPLEVEGNTGDTITLKVVVNGITDPDGLGAYDLQVRFNEDVVNVIACASGEGLFSQPPVVCNLNISGSALFNGWQSIQIPGPKGDQIVARLKLIVTGDPGDETVLSFVSSEIRDANGNEIEVGEMHGHVNVVSGPAEPTPPTSTPLPEPTATPIESPVVTPVSTTTPVPTSVPAATATPVPTSVPAATATPVPTSAPAPLATPVPTSAPAPTATPVSTAIPDSKATPVPTATPTPTPAIVLEGTASPVSTSIPSHTPTVGHDATMAPSPTSAATGQTFTSTDGGGGACNARPGHVSGDLAIVLVPTVLLGVYLRYQSRGSRQR